MFKLSVLFVPFVGAYGVLLYVNPGQNVTLPCFYDSGATNLGWYKQVAGEKPQIISSFYRHLTNSNSFYNQFKDNKRFSVHPGSGFYHLNISNVQDSDSAMYFCGQTSITMIEFQRGTFLVLKESSRRSFLQQPASNSVKPGGSVTLNCTVHAGTRDTGHSVYWFKKENSNNSHLGILYIHTDSNRCVQSLESPSQTCVYGLSRRNVSPSEAGTYYCAVASCGEILFGRGTRLEVEEKQDGVFPLLMQFVVAALAVSIVLNAILIFILCKVTWGKQLHSGGLHPQSSVPEFTANCQNEEFDAMQYVALDFTKKKNAGSSRRQRSTEDKTIYSGVRLSDRK